MHVMGDALQCAVLCCAVLVEVMQIDCIRYQTNGSGRMERGYTDDDDGWYPLLHRHQEGKGAFSPQNNVHWWGGSSQLGGKFSWRVNGRKGGWMGGWEEEEWEWGVMLHVACRMSHVACRRTGPPHVCALPQCMRLLSMPDTVVGTDPNICPPSPSFTQTKPVGGSV